MLQIARFLAVMIIVQQSLLRPAMPQQPTTVNAVTKVARQARLSFELGGVLQTAHVQPGSEVKIGQRLLILKNDSATFDFQRTSLEVQTAQQLAADQTDLEYAQKSYAVARNEYLRAVASEEKFSQSTSKSELDRLKLMMDLAELSVTQSQQSQLQKQIALELAENEQAKAQHALDLHQLISPLQGIVTTLQVQQGETIVPHQPVVTIINLDTLHVEGFVSQATRTTLKLNQPIHFLVNLRGNAETVYPGKIVFLSPEIDTLSGECLIRAEVDNHDRQLLAGVRGVLRLSED